MGGDQQICTSRGVAALFSWAAIGEAAEAGTEARFCRLALRSYRENPNYLGHGLKTLHTKGSKPTTNIGWPHKHGKSDQMLTYLAIGPFLIH